VLDLIQCDERVLASSERPDRIIELHAPMVAGGCDTFGASRVGSKTRPRTEKMTQRS
jgi:hypothetical protein